MSQLGTADREIAHDPRRGITAGVGAALAMLAAMVVLRITTAIPSLPEIIGEGIIGLMPAPVFSAILDTMQKAAKPTLYVGILVGMLGVGALLGRGFAFGEPSWRSAIRLAAILWAVFGVVVLPLLGMGLFGSAIRVGMLLLAAQHAVVFFAFAAALVLLLRATEPAAPQATRRERRRAALIGLTGGLVAVAAAGTGWRALLGTPSTPVSTANLPAPGRGGAETAPAAGPDGAAAAPAGAGPSVPAVGVRGVPPLDAPAVPMTVLPNQPAAAPFDLPKLSPEVLTAASFYTVSKNLIDPSVDAATWSLTVDGLVERPTTYVYADLAALPVHSDYYSLQCISNTIGGDLFGNAHWKGVRLVELLSRAGLKAGIRKVVFHADDGYTDSIALDVALRPDTLVAYEMNGERLTKEHGFPARLLIPGIYGMKNVKWVTRIELADTDFRGYWMQRGWSDSAVYHTSSRIDTPASRATVPAGEVALGGIAFAGSRGIDRVEVSLDDGNTWEAAQLKPALSLNAWSLWVYRKPLAVGTYMVKVRATDGNGDVQTSFETDPLPDGATGYHSILLRVG